MSKAIVKTNIVYQIDFLFVWEIKSDCLIKRNEA